jgi:hypothetical protein
MKKLVIYKDSLDQVTGKTKRNIIRCIQPSLAFAGYGKFGVNDSEFKKLAHDLEPSLTGYFLS